MTYFHRPHCGNIGLPTTKTCGIGSCNGLWRHGVSLPSVGNLHLMLTTPPPENVLRAGSSFFCVVSLLASSKPSLRSILYPSMLVFFDRVVIGKNGWPPSRPCWNAQPDYCAICLLFLSQTHNCQQFEFCCINNRVAGCVVHWRRRQTEYSFVSASTSWVLRCCTVSGAENVNFRC